jgi:hypothetical protein
VDWQAASAAIATARAVPRKAVGTFMLLNIVPAGRAGKGRSDAHMLSSAMRATAGRAWMRSNIAARVRCRLPSAAMSTSQV